MRPAISRKPADGFADEYSALGEYEGPTGRRYRETIDLDLGVFWNLLHVDRKNVHDIRAVEGDRQRNQRVDRVRRWRPPATLASGVT